MAPTADPSEPWEVEETLGIPDRVRRRGANSGERAPFQAPAPVSAAAEVPDEYYVFFDDCTLGDKGKAGHFIGRGGFAVRRSELHAFGKDFQNIIWGKGTPTFDPLVDTEVCWSPATASFFGSLRDRDVPYEELLRLLRRHDCVAFTSVISLGSINRAGWDRNRARREALKYVTERAEYFLRHKVATGRMFIDEELAPTRDEHPKVQVEALLSGGSDYSFKFTQLNREVRVLESHAHFGVQMADLVVGTATRRVADFVQKGSRLAPMNPKSVPSTDRLWTALRGRFAYVSDGGDVSTPQVYGLSILPTRFNVPFVEDSNPYTEP